MGGVQIVNRFKAIIIVALLLLAACGPADVDGTANQAASAVPPDIQQTAEALLSAVPPDINATAEAMISAVTNDPTVEALVNDPTVQALANDLTGLIPPNLSFQRDQPLVLGTTREVADVTNYRWTVAEVPAGAESVRGTLISENSNGKLTLEPNDYAKYFPVAGNYTVNLELTYTGGNKDIVPIPLIVP